MSSYTKQPQVNYVPHSFNSATLLINGKYKILALDKVKSDPKTAKVSTQSVASGHAQFVLDESQEGSFEFTLLASSPSTDVLVDLLNAGMPISFSYTDANAPRFNVSSDQGMIEQHPTIENGKEIATPTWRIVCTYMMAQGGSYALQTAP